MPVDPARALGLGGAAGVSALLADLVGGDVAGRRGVLHVTSVWAPPEREPVVLRILPETPRSRLDAFLLGAARAWADAVVTTGRILREEPGLVHWPPGPPEAQAALEAWRREAVGRMEPPQLLVLTRLRGSDLAHPALAAGLPVTRFDRGDLRAALAFLREERGATRIAVEAGPSSSRSLYEDPLAVDELWLSRFLEPGLPEHLAGGCFPPQSPLAALLPEASPAVVALEASGRWSFQGRRRPRSA